MLGTFHAVGDIDLATAPGLYSELHDTIDGTDADVVVVECSGVTFMDSSGYHVLVEATHYAVRRGRTLVVCNMSRSCRRLIALCDRDRELRLEPCPQIATSNQEIRATAPLGGRVLTRLPQFVAETIGAEPPPGHRLCCGRSK